MPIVYDEEISKRPGRIGLAPNDMQEDDQNTLLHLLFAVIYTPQGRAFLAANSPPAGATPEQIEAIRQGMKQKISADYGIHEPVLVDALIDGHFAADAYVKAFKENAPGTTLELHDRVYQQKMSFVMWRLWEDFLGHEFSMIW